MEPQALEDKVVAVAVLAVIRLVLVVQAAQAV
jgi:hypothetical protein